MFQKQDCPIPTSYQSDRCWIIRLPDPFSPGRWFPLDSQTMADLLDVSDRTARRYCEHPARLRRSQLAWLQVCIFGLIPDPAFVRLGVFFQGGRLYSRQLPGVNLGPGDLAAWEIERQAASMIRGDLTAARRRIDELERLLNPDPSPPSNVIRFPGRH